MNSRSKKEEILAQAAARYAELERDDGSSELEDLDPSLPQKWSENGQVSISFPESLNIYHLNKWNDLLWSSSAATHLNLDFQAVRFIPPQAILYIAHQLKHFHREFPATRVKVTNADHQPYLTEMGFFECLQSVTVENSVLAPGQNRIPIRTIDTRAFHRQSGVTNVRDSIDSETARLSKVLTRLDSGFAFDTVQYSLREIIRNIFEHSGSSICAYCAQYWPTRNRVQLAIVDEGMGIFPSLTQNPKFKHLTPRQAVQYSLLPGVSGNYVDLQGQTTNSVWRNTGYGLYMTSRLARRRGWFTVISSGHMILLRGKDKQVLSTKNFKGTMISLDFFVDQDASLSSYLRELAEEGKNIAQNIQGAKVIDASAASQMLSRDFRKIYPTGKITG